MYTSKQYIEEVIKKDTKLKKLKVSNKDLTKKTSDGHADDDTQIVLKGGSVYDEIIHKGRI
ncbi:MAG: hypothetical protein KAS32_30050 [Candidatus Peribacteraceae bacterium]|nr:hypothetical protein [Candidatus Peribacteraceae bacterium]